MNSVFLTLRRHSYSGASLSCSEQALQILCLIVKATQYELLSLKKITTVKNCEAIEVDGFMNYRFKIVRGNNNKEFEFTFVDLPLMNPNDWIVQFNILLTEKTNYANQLYHLKKMIISYLMEFCNVDVEVASVFQKNTTMKPSK
ncbi:unnamed protein product [Lactuca saligna]|uniref:Uncharacterized protein n=1 Tax=Lactuca saligna TaxID=75948 RepID=A0AA35V2W6_LACSI|nr:unnamed protein product [Lactuca saligna]